MGKELTLEELAQSSKNNKSTGTTKTTTITESKAGTPSGTGKNAKPISTSQLGKNLAAQHPEEVAAKNGPLEEDSPLVKEAFDAMHKTIEERKSRVNQAMPYIEENARKIAAEEAENGDATVEQVQSAPRQQVPASQIMNPVDMSAADDEEISPKDSDWGDDFDDDEDEFIINTDSDLDVSVEAKAAEPKPEPKQEEVKSEEELKEAQEIAAAARLGDIALKSVGGLSEEDTGDANQEVEVEDTEETNITTITKDENDIDYIHDTSEDLDSLLKDLGIDEYDDGSEDFAEEETAEEIRAKVTESFKNVKVIKDPVDLATFKIRSVPTSSSSVLNNIDKKLTKKRADWALYYTGRSITFEECRGPELDNLQKTIQGSSGFSGVVATLQFIYNHIVDANKPTFEQWAKMIRAEDIESLYFGMYRACYMDSNLVPCECPNKTCKKTSMIDIPIDDMVSFKDDDVKKEFYEIMSQDPTTPAKRMSNTLLQISDDLVISYSNATLYSTYIQLAALNQDLVDKYEDIINFMAYVDSFFVLNRSTKELVPLAIKQYPNNLTKSVKVKLGAFVNVLKRLTPDQYNTLRAKLNSIANSEIKVEYKIPDVECPECGNKIPGSDVDSCMSLLFTRAQLAQVQNL